MIANLPAARSTATSQPFRQGQLGLLSPELKNIVFSHIPLLAQEETPFLTKVFYDRMEPLRRYWDLPEANPANPDYSTNNQYVLKKLNKHIPPEQLTRLFNGQPFSGSIEQVSTIVHEARYNKLEPLRKFLNLDVPENHAESNRKVIKAVSDSLKTYPADILSQGEIFVGDVEQVEAITSRMIADPAFYKHVEECKQVIFWDDVEANQLDT